MTPRRTLALLGLVLLLVLGELVARVYGDRICTDTPGVFTQGDTRFGWTHVPGLRGHVTKCQDARLPPAWMEAGPTGLVDPARPREKPAHTARMVLLGGNAPEGLGVRPDLRMARRLETLPDTRHGDALQVINAGTGGWAMDQSLAWLRAEGLGYAPDLVVLVVDPGSELSSLSPVLLASLGQSVPRKPFLTLRDGALVPRAAPPGAPPAPPLEAQGVLDHLQLWRLLTGVTAVSGPPLAWAEAGPLPPTTEVEAEREAVDALARAILTAMRDETAATGGRLVLVIGPQPGWLRRQAPSDRQAFRAMARDLGIPMLDLEGAFAVAADTRAPFFAGSPRWTASGHELASQNLWQFLRDESLLPTGLVASLTPGGAGIPPPGQWPARIADGLWTARLTPLGVFLQAALLATCAIWAAVILPPRVRDVVAVVLGVLVTGAVAGAPLAAGLLVAGVLVHGAAVLPWRWRWLRRVVVTAVLAAALALPVATAPAGMPYPLASERLGVALVGAFAWLRLVAHAARRPLGRAPHDLLGWLVALFLPATLVAGPSVAAADLARRRPPGGPVPETPAALRAWLVAAGRGVGTVLAALLALQVATALLGTRDIEVAVTGGTTLSRLALWGWVVESGVRTALLVAGLVGLGAGLLRMAGVRPPAAFRRPWAAATPAAFWSRWLVPVAGVLRHDVLGRRGRAALGGLLTFVLAAAWATWIPLVLLGWRWMEVIPSTGHAVWAALAAASVAVTWRLGTPRVARGAGVAATLLIAAVGTVAFFWPEPIGWPRLLAVVLRLVGLA